MAFLAVVSFSFFCLNYLENLKNQSMELKPTPTTPNQIVTFSTASLSMTLEESEKYIRNNAEAALDASETRKRVAAGLLSKAHKVAEWIEEAAGDNPAEAVKQYLAALSTVSPALASSKQTDTTNTTNQSINIFSEEQAHSILATIRQQETENRPNEAGNKGKG